MKSAFLLLSVSLIALTACNKDCNPTGNCSLEPDPGNCLAYMPRYYFDKEGETCKEFIWGGCGGTVPFETLEECEKCSCN